MRNHSPANRPIALHREEVHELGSARRLTGPRELTSVHYDVDSARFAGVGTTGDSDFSAAIRKELVRPIGTLYELGFWVL